MKNHIKKILILGRNKLNLINMKKLLVSSLILFLLNLSPAGAQVGKFLKNVKNSVKQELTGTPDNKNKKGNTRPEPPCACDPSDLIMELGKYQIDYTELNISVLDDGSILVRDNVADNYYIAKSGATEGPYKSGDPRLDRFQVPANNGSEVKEKDLPEVYKGYISKAGEKYLITFNGKNYGPYALITKFSVSNSGDKFAAMATENIVATEDEGKKMEEAIKNAKTDQERMELAMQYSQKIQQKMMSGGGPQSMMSKLVTNVQGVKVDDMLAMGAQLYSNMKYDDILLVSFDKIMDLQGKTLMTFNRSECDPASIYISSDNSRYACYRYGTLTFSDSKTLSELFNPHLIKAEGKVYLAYMYYSPKRNAIMQCKIPF